ncbi:MAG: family 78 glycoside hydrolase catalytic domain, partial [Clostridiales bacterium]|nr:family 78 glycoside hydrolase catalytic domain [Clostridiales bacterium]
MRKLFKRILCSMLSVMLGVGCMPAAFPAAAADETITDLKVNQLTEPLGVDDTPVFSWVIHSAGFGGAQSAYQIYVATDEKKAAAGQGDVWDSGKVPSGASYNVSYAGAPLSSKTDYYWTVKVWDEKDALLGVSSPAHFHTGIYHSEEWEGDWIGYPQAHTEKMTLDGAEWLWVGGQDSASAGGHAAGTQFFRKTFTLENVDKVASARLAWTADDQSTMYFNGVEIGSSRAWTSGGMSDVTGLLVEGENCIALRATNTGDGYAGAIARMIIDYKSASSEAPAEPVNLAQGKTVAASSAEHNPDWGWNLDFVVDGNRENQNGSERAGYCSKNDTDKDHSEWVSVDLGEKTPVNRFVFYPSANLTDGKWICAAVPKSYEIQVSDDGTQWAKVAEGGFEARPEAGPQTVEFQTVEARYVRLYASSLLQNGDYRLKLSEIEVYGGAKTQAPGQRLDIVSDQTWTGCTEEVSGWNQIQCDKGNWVKPQQHVPYGADPWKTNLSISDVNDANRAAVSLRREFEVGKKVASAYAYICGLGFFTLTVNGQAVTDSVMNPAPTQYDMTSLYCVYDISRLLEEGANALGVELGNSFYNETGGVWNWPNAYWRDNPKCLVNVELTYTDGSKETIASGTDWKVSREGPITSNSLYYGDEYDARKALVDVGGKGFDQAGYDDSGWDDAFVMAAPANRKGETAALKWQHEEPNMRTKTFQPSRIQQLDEDSWAVTCPVMTTGWAKLSGINLPAGQEITITYSEKQHADGTVMKLGGADGEGENWFSEANICQDHYISDGSANASYEPRYSYKGYQYIQIDGWTGDFTADNIEMYLINNAMEQTGSFETSSEMLNAMQEMMVRTVLNNQQGRITDTPVYEKNGWTGDANMMLDTIYYNFAAENVMETFLNMLADTQKTFGNVADIVPSADSFHDNHPTWNTVFPFGITKMCRYYGSYAYAEEMYPALRAFAQTDIGVLQRQGWLWPGGSYGDWCSPSNLHDGDAPINAGASEGSRITDNAMLYGALSEIAELTRLLYDRAREAKDTELARSYKADLDLYNETLQKMYDAYNARFYDESKGCYDTGDWSPSNDRTRYRQTSQLASLAYGLVPEDKVQGVVDSLAKDIVEKDYHLDTGIVGTKLILPMLDQYGHEELAFRIATQTTYPSWGFWLSKGATSCWENWETTTRSLNHHMFGSASEWFYSGLAGIQNVENGYETYTIDPAFTGNLDYVNCSIETVRGTLTSNWALNDDGTTTMELTVPFGSTAAAYLPTADKAGVRVNGQSLSGAPGVKQVTTADGRLCLTLGSGSYTIQLTDTYTDLYTLALAEGIKTAEGLNASKYPAELQKALQDALQKARRLSEGDKPQVTQKAVNAAERELAAIVTTVQGSEARQALYAALAAYGDVKDLSGYDSTLAAAYQSAVLTAENLAQDYAAADWQLEAAENNLETVYQLMVVGEAQNLALHKTCKASSAENNSSWGWSLSFATDGDRQNANHNNEYAGYSSSENTGRDHSEWIYVDLGAPTDINKVRFYPSSALENGKWMGYGAPKSFEIQVSDDGESWTKAAEGGFDAVPEYGPQSLEFETVEARYVRLYASSLFAKGNDYRLQITELEVFHVPTLPVQPEGLLYLAVSDGALSPVFDYFETDYTARVKKSVSRMTLTPYATEGTAITVNGKACASGDAASVPLAMGENRITLTAGGVAYTLTVTREEGGDQPDILPGDLDGNGEVTIQDVMEACKVLARQ